MIEHSGPQWCLRYPGSNSLEDLVPPFRDGAKGFIDALRHAGAAVDVSATWRPEQRAYLMHWCCLVAGYRDAAKVFHQISPGDVPAHPGIDIDWTCGGDPGAARSAAVAMVAKYGIVYPAELVSNHTKRQAIDMTIHFQGSIMVAAASGRLMPAAALTDLFPIGATYGVHKLVKDVPHWSIDGH